MNFYETIEKRYGGHARKQFTNYAKEIHRQSRLTPNRKFLLECRKHSLIPKFIKNSTNKIYKLINNNSKYVHNLNNIVKNFHKKLLNVIIQDTCSLTQHSQDTLYNLQEQLLNNTNLHLPIVDDFLRRQKQYLYRERTKREAIHAKKFNELYNAIISELNFHVDDRAFVNLTSIMIPNDIGWLLSMGPKFNLPNNRWDFPLFDMIADTEEIVKSIQDPKTRDIARAKITNIVSSSIFVKQKQSNDLVNRTIERIYKKTTTFIKEHKDLVIVPSDKGKATVVMFRQDYDRKIKELLSDTKTYKIEKSSPLNSLQIKNNKFVDRLYKLKIIDKREKFKLSTYNGTDPKLYALPKTHKPNVPCRPVSASIDTATSGVSKMLSGILKKMIENDPYNIQNSFAFKNRISEITIDNADSMVSFDIVSLFTNIPVKLAIDIIKEQWNEICKYTCIPKDLFFEMLDFCLIDGNYFVFNSTTYRQLFGMPMGNPLSTVIADIITRRLLDVTLAKLNYTPQLLVKYVDDIFAIIPKDSIDETLEVLNSFHPRLKFTVEFEIQGKIPYLDVMVIRDSNGGINTDWYKKSVSSNRILNYYSNHPEHHKSNTAINFIARVLNLSSPCYHKQNRRLITDILKSNNYPQKMINKYITRYFQKLNTRNTMDNESSSKDNNNKHYKALTYTKGISERVEKVVKTYCPDIRLAHKPANGLRKIFTRLKDRIPREKQTNIIYQIPCHGNTNDGSSCQLSYVGQTKQYLERRLMNHRRDLLKAKEQSSPRTALVDHCLSKDHQPNFNAAKILAKSNHYGRRLTIEALHIINENSMNIKQDTDHIAPVYCALIDDNHSNTYKRRRTHMNTDEHNTHKRRRLS